MKIIYKSTLVVLCLLALGKCYSQANYQPGFVITQKGDSLVGLIDYRDWERNPKKITFRDPNTGEVTGYNPISIKKFQVAEKIYIGAIVTVDSASHELSKLSTIAEMQPRIDTVFLQCIMQGNKGLYIYRDKDNKDFFFITNSNASEGLNFELLVYKKYLKQGAMVVNKKFIGQIANYLDDCPTIKSKLQKLQYNRKSLEETFSFYYQCTNSKIEFHDKREKIAIETGVMGGLSVSKLDFSGDGFAYLAPIDFSTSVNPTLALFLNFVLPRNQQKWSFSNEIMYTSYKTSGTDFYYEDENYQRTTDVTFEYAYLKMNNMFRFSYPTKAIRIFFNAGIINGFVISETNVKETESIFINTVTNETEKALPETRKYLQGFNFGLGARRKKYSFEVRYERDNAMSSYTELKSITNKVYFLVGYKF